MSAAHQRRDAATFHELDRRFHGLFVLECGNREVVDLDRMLRQHLEWARAASRIRSKVLPHSLAQHQKIVAAVLRRDAAASQAALREHLDSVRAALLEPFQQTPS